MEMIRVAWGTATGPTAMSSFDAALAEANAHNFNIVELSSVVPADATVESVGTLPDLGPTGDALYCVVARQTLAPDEEGVACAGLGWARSPSGRGIFYEASGSDETTVRHAVETGLDAGMDLREWTTAERDVVIETEPADPSEHATAVAVAAYGRSESLLGD